MAERALATAFVNIVPGTVELEKYLKGKLEQDMEKVGVSAGKKLTDGLSKSLKAAGAKMSQIGTGLTVGVTAPLTAIGVKAIQSSADFGVAMASLQVNSGASGAAMEKMRDLAIKMGQDTVFSAGEAAQAMLELSKGGMDPAVISGGALESTMALAATEGISLAESATIVTQAMNTFGLSAEDSMKAVDILAAGAVASTASIYDLSGGLKFVGSTAAGIGVPMEDAVTALAALNNAGIDSTTAGTSLNRMLLGLIPSTKKSKEAMKDLGVSFLNQDGSVKSLGEVVGILEQKMAGLSDSERIKALKDMFGVEGMRAAAILLEQGADGFAGLSEQVGTAGVASELSNARMSGLAGAIEQMKGSIDTAFLAVGDRLTPATTQISGFITTLVNGFSNLTPATQQVIVTIAAVVAALGPMLIFIGKLTQAIGVMIPVVVKLWAVMAANPIGAIITAIGLIVAGLVYFFTQTETGKKAWASFTQFLSDAWKNTTKFFSDAWNKVSKFFTDAWTNIKKIFSSALDFVVKLFLNWTAPGLIIKNWDKIVQFFSTAWNGIIGFFKKALDFIVNLFMNWTLYGVIIKNWSKIVAFFKNAPGQLIGFFRGLPAQFIQMGKDIISGLINGAGTLLPKIGEFFLDMLPGWIVTPFKKALGIASPSKLFAVFGKNIIQGLNRGLTTSASSIESTMEKVSEKIAKAFEDKKISAATAKTARNLVTQYKQALLGLEKELGKVQERIADAQDKLNDKIEEKLDYVRGVVGSYGSSLSLETVAVDPLRVAEAQNKVNEAAAKYNEILKETTANSTEVESARLDLLQAEQDLADVQKGSTTADDAVKQLQDRIAKSKELRRLTQQLIDLGLDKNIIRQIVEAQAVDFAQSVVAGGKAAVKELNVLADEANRQAKLLGEQVGAVLYDEGIEFAKSVVKGLKDREQDIKDIMDRVAREFGNNLERVLKGLKIQTPEVDNSNNRIIFAPLPNSVSGSTAAAIDPPKGSSGGGGGSAMPWQFMAAGGYVTGPTPAIIGEAGPEVVVPLRDFERMMGITDGAGKTINYYAAPNQSLDSEQALFQAMKRAKVVAGW